MQMHNLKVTTNEDGSILLSKIDHAGEEAIVALCPEQLRLVARIAAYLSDSDAAAGADLEPKIAILRRQAMNKAFLINLIIVDNKAKAATIHPDQINCFGCSLFQDFDGEMTCMDCRSFDGGVPPNPYCFEGGVASAADGAMK